MSYLTETALRLAAMQLEIDTDSDAKGFAIWRQEGMKYWTNAFTDFTPGPGTNEQYSQRFHTVDMRYFVGYTTEGQPGEVEEAICEILPTIQTWFEERPGLTSVAYPDIQRYLDPLETRLLPSPVVVNLGKGPSGGDMLGTIIRLQVMYNISLTVKN